MSIPKVIHLCWFSGEEYPTDVQKCVESWKKHLPDYEIKIWNYDMAEATEISFVKEALSVRKWAFAADVIRLYALYTEGGVYMDSDIFIKRRFDEFLHSDFVSFNEFHADLFKKSKKNIDKLGNKITPDVTISGFGIQAAFLASSKGNSFVKMLLEYYTNKNFILPDGTYYTKIIAPCIYACEAEKLGYRYIDETQFLAQNITIYESKFLAGGITENSNFSFGIHCCSHSWWEPSGIAIIKATIKKIFNLKKWYRPISISDLK